MRVYIYGTRVYRYMDMCTNMHICRYTNLDSAPYANEFKCRMYTGISKFNSTLVYMHMYVYTYTHICVKMYAWIQIYISTHVRETIGNRNAAFIKNRKCTRIYMYAYVCIYTYMYIYICSAIQIRHAPQIQWIWY